jgi:acyl-CoA synthetase (AMP-forming)/AMP-acid ligase II
MRHFLGATTTYRELGGAIARRTEMRTVISAALSAPLPWSSGWHSLTVPKARRTRAEMRCEPTTGVLSWEHLERRPESYEAILLPADGFRTGDIAVMDEEGFITIADRIKELTITDGFDAYPSEVENVLRAQSDKDAAVVGMPTEDGDMQVVAVVVGSGGTRLDTEAIPLWAREHVAGSEAPRSVIEVAELPPHRDRQGTALAGRQSFRRAKP